MGRMGDQCVMMATECADVSNRIMIFGVFGLVDVFCCDIVFLFC